MDDYITSKKADIIHYSLHFILFINYTNLYLYLSKLQIFMQFLIYLFLYILYYTYINSKTRHSVL